MVINIDAHDTLTMQDLPLVLTALRLEIQENKERAERLSDILETFDEILIGGQKETK